MRCSFCDRPAIRQARGWHRLFGRVPVFPRVLAYCAFHWKPQEEKGEGDDANQRSQDGSS
jgi:hypothetical protein